MVSVDCRFTEIRDTVQGKQEERNPFFSFAFPPWFKEKYRDAYDNFSKNVDRLTTPFDIYSTLRQVLHFGDSDDSDVNQFFKDRSLSLFSEVSITYFTRLPNIYFVFPSYKQLKFLSEL